MLVSVTLVVSVTEVIRSLTWVLALVMHVSLCPSLPPILRGWHPGPGTPGVAEAGSGVLPLGDTPAQCATRPWGHGQSQSRVLKHGQHRLTASIHQPSARKAVRSCCWDKVLIAHLIDP